MLVTGEEAGRVDSIAEQIAAIYEEEVEIAVNTLGETLQPIFTIFIGVVVMILFAALFLPIIGMIQQLTGATG
jgi:type II secretory pathway component PulF